MSKAVEPRMGQIWKEVDPRFERYVCILSRTKTMVRICTCDAKGKKLRHRETASSVDRFNGKRGGYAYHGRVDVVLSFEGEDHKLQFADTSTGDANG